MSLRSKLVLIFLLFGLFLMGVASVVFYVALRRALNDKLSSELMHEAEEFANLAVLSHDSLKILEENEWSEIEHVKVSEYSRYMVIADTGFRTIRKTDNLHGVDLQSWFKFEPAALPYETQFLIDSAEYRCVVYPIVRSSRRVGYILSAGSNAVTEQAIAIFEDRLGIAMGVMMGFGLIGALFFANSLTRPLGRIREVADAMTANTMHQRIQVQSPENEIGRVTQALNELFERLERSFRQINDFSSNVSHELRTPLTILRGTIEVALSRERSPNEHETILTEILEETIRIQRIVDDLLMLARADAKTLRIDRKPLRLKDCCDEFVEDFKMICGFRKQKFVPELDPAVVILADQNLIYQLLLNLITNASKFSPIGSEVGVLVKQENGACVIAVVDRGIGIDPADQAHLFERFYRVDRTRSRETGGTGLGLSICRMIAELHDGRITVDSTPGSGTTVTVTIPLLK